MGGRKSQRNGYNEYRINPNFTTVDGGSFTTSFDYTIPKDGFYYITWNSNYPVKAYVTTTTDTIYFIGSANSWADAHNNYGTNFISHFFKKGDIFSGRQSGTNRTQYYTVIYK